MPTTEQEIIAHAIDTFGSDAEYPGTGQGRLLWALEAFYFNGVTDEWSGDVDAPTGHFYRVNRWIVTTDERGFHNVISHATKIEAKYGFDVLVHEYSSWIGNEDEDDDERNSE